MNGPMSTNTNPAPTTPLPATGNAAAVAARVDGVVEIVQPRGAFFRFTVNVDESLQTHFLQPTANAAMGEDNHLMVYVELSFEATVNPSADAPATAEPELKPVSEPSRRLLARVDAGFVIVYRLTPGDRPSDEDLRAFAQANGVFNATPYWREFLHSSLMRAGLPPIIAPVLKLGPEARPESAKAQG